MTKIASAPRIDDLRLRIWTEFQDLPGLRLTIEQACRLWGRGPDATVEALNDLVASAVLRKVGPYYLRADLGRFSA